MSPNDHHLTAKVVFAGLISLGTSCEVNPRSDSVQTSPPDSTGGQEDKPDTDAVEEASATQEQGELLEYCQKVKEISDKQQEIDRKLEEILTHVESLNSPPQTVSLNEDKKKALREGWLRIEAEKKTAIDELGGSTPSTKGPP